LVFAVICFSGLAALFRLWYISRDLPFLQAEEVGAQLSLSLPPGQLDLLLLVGVILFGFGALWWLLAGLSPTPGKHRWLHRSMNLVHLAFIIGVYQVLSLSAVAAAGEASDWYSYVIAWGLLPLIGWIALSWAQLVHWTGSVFASYGIELDEDDEAPGDRFIENIRTGGGDREYQRSWITTILLLLAILILPFLIPGGCDRYAIPPGSGTPAAPPVAVQEVVEEEEEEYILADNSPIIFDAPDPTESTAVQQLVQHSERTYESSASGTPGAVGEGGGTEGGWPDGNHGPIRFIRIKHRGYKWNDGMDASTGNADLNFMTWLEKEINLPNFKVAPRSEAMTISQIYNNFEEGYRPPFVYLTGDGRFSFSGSERKVLRKLLLEGTMLFADAGSPDFHRSFTSEMRQVFRDKPLVDIGDEDTIMTIPKRFRHGLKANQWHGPSKAMGIRHEKRWIVFYHPGDANDLWKDEASRVQRDIRLNAYDIGYNLVWYSFTRYLEVTRDLRK
jgi:hypothetical protein